MASVNYTTPAQQPPPGQQSNFDDPESIQNALYGFIAAILLLTTFSTVARVHTRFLARFDARCDDYLMLIGWAGNVALSAIIIQGVRNGSGRHMWDVRLLDLPSIAYWTYFVKILYCVVYGMVKVSICLQVLRIFVVRGTRTFWVVCGFTGFQALLFFIAFWLYLFQCHPISKAWNLTGPGKCLPGYKTFAFSIGVINLSSDVLMFIFPLFCISKLHMQLRRKFALAAVFLIGMLAIVASIVRVVFLSWFLQTGKHLTYGTDLTFTEVQITACSSAEIAAGIIIGNSISLPRFFSLVKEKLDSMRGSVDSRSPIVARNGFNSSMESHKISEASFETRSLQEIEARTKV